MLLLCILRLRWYGRLILHLRHTSCIDCMVIGCQNLSFSVVWTMRDLLSAASAIMVPVLQHSIAAAALQWDTRNTGTNKTYTDDRKPRLLGVLALGLGEADSADPRTIYVLGLFSEQIQLCHLRLLRRCCIGYHDHLRTGRHRTASVDGICILRTHGLRGLLLLLRLVRRSRCILFLVRNICHVVD